MAGHRGRDDSQFTTAATLLNLSSGAPRIETTGEVVLLSICEILVLLLSTFIILLIWTKEDLRRNYTNWLVSNACLVLFVGAVGHRWQYIVMVSQGGAWILWDASCYVASFSQSMFQFNRPMSLILISVTCALFVYDPLTFSKKITKKAILLMIGLPWLVSIVYAGFRTYNVSVLVINESQRSCYHEDYFTLLSGLVSTTILHCLMYSGLLIVTSVVFVFSYRHHRSSPKGDPELAKERWKQAMQATILTATVNGLYILMTLPMFVVVMQMYLQESPPRSESGRTAYVFSCIYDVIQLFLWMALIPDVTYSIKSLSQCCAKDKAESTRLL